MTGTLQRPWHYFFTIAMVAIAFWVTGRLTLETLNLGVEASPIWPPAGIALGALLLQGRWAWPGVTLGALLIAQSLGVSWGMALGAALGSTAQAWIAVTLLRKIRFRAAIERLRDVLALIVVGVLLAPIVNATVSTGVGLWTGYVRADEWLTNGWTLCLGDGMGILVITPILLTIPERWPVPKGHFRCWEWGGFFVLLGAVSWVVFLCGRGTMIAHYPLEYLPFPVLVWGALRFGQLSAFFGTLLVSSMAMQGAIAGSGPFITKAANQTEAVLFLQAFTGVIAITVLILATAATQLRATAQRNRLLKDMSLRIRHSLDVANVLNTTVAEVRQFFQADRVFISRFGEDGQGWVVAESVAEPWPSLLNARTGALAYEQFQLLFQDSRFSRVEDIQFNPTPPLLQECHTLYRIRASLAVAIWLEGRLFGILVVNQCSGPRQWQPMEVDLLDQLATQVTIAIQQGHLYEQVQRLNASLEAQVDERTALLQQKMGELQEVNQLKDVFLHALSHDLRTTVMGTLLVLKSMQSQSGDCVAIARPLLERLIHGGEHQLSKLNALLEAYSSYSQGLVLHPQWMDLQGLVMGVLEEMAPCFQANQVTCQMGLPPDLPWVYGDSVRLQQVFEQLLSNAVKHNPPGVHIRVDAKLRDDELYWTIQDNGVGIGAGQRDRLFDLCVESADGNQQLSGIQLGLYLSRQIISAHGGKIGVHSQPGAGSTFWFTLPLTVRPSPETSQEPSVLATASS